ncbi:MAG: hypothetical protein J6C77_07155 [Muribaculaceae bacterium]|nr:hypothetical protein [Muribaculaceae bacterium]
MSRILHNICIKAIATAAIAISAFTANATTYEYFTNYPGVKRLINGVYYQTGWAQIKTDFNEQISNYTTAVTPYFPASLRVFTL